MGVMNEYCNEPMTSDPIPLLWLCGPSGVGKSTVGWQFFTQLTRTGIRIGYLDIDQLGMCYPAPASDPERHRIKAQNLGAVVATFQAAGTRCVIVSGVVDAVHGVRTYVDQLPQVALTVCRLRADHDVLAERLVSRGRRSDQLDAVLREADILDYSDFADTCVDTSGIPVSEVIRMVREQAGRWPALAEQTHLPNSQAPTTYFPTVHSAPGSILWLCGTTGVGKSTVGWQIFEDVRRAGVTAAFVDLEQIGFCQPVSVDDPDNHQVKAHNLAAMWQTFRASGARCLIVVGPVNHPDAVRIYTDALPEAALTLCRLHAGPDQLRHRIMLRGQGRGPRIPGDELDGKPAASLQWIAEKAAAVAEALHRAAIGDLCIDTDGRTIEEVAQVVLARANGWPEPDDGTFPYQLWL